MAVIEVSSSGRSSSLSGDLGVDLSAYFWVTPVVNDGVLTMLEVDPDLSRPVLFAFVGAVLSMGGGLSTSTMDSIHGDS